MNCFSFPTRTKYINALKAELAIVFEMKSTGTQTEESICCVVCMDAKATHVASECGHFNYCGECIESLTKCPLCNKKTSFVKVYR